MTTYDKSYYEFESKNNALPTYNKDFNEFVETIKKDSIFIDNLNKYGIKLPTIIGNESPSIFFPIVEINDTEARPGYFPENNEANRLPTWGDAIAWIREWPKKILKPENSGVEASNGAKEADKTDKVNENKEVKKEKKRSENNDMYFNRMLDFILKLEGGYVNDPNDSGGETNRGITKRTYDAYRRKKGLPTQSVKNITQEEIRDIYYNNYYVASGANKISNPQIAFIVFDIAVHCGSKTAKKMYEKCGDDIDKLNQLRREHYAKCIERNPKNKKFERGWENRAIAAIDYARSNFPDNAIA